MAEKGGGGGGGCVCRRVLFSKKKKKIGISRRYRTLLFFIPWGDAARDGRKRGFTVYIYTGIRYIPPQSTRQSKKIEKIEVDGWSEAREGEGNLV